MEKSIAHYASMVLEWLDIDARQHHVPREQLVGLFMDALQGLDEQREQEE